MAIPIAIGMAAFFMARGRANPFDVLAAQEADRVATSSANDHLMTIGPEQRDYGQGARAQWMGENIIADGYPGAGGIADPDDGWLGGEGNPFLRAASLPETVAIKRALAAHKRATREYWRDPHGGGYKAADDSLFGPNWHMHRQDNPTLFSF